MIYTSLNDTKVEDLNGKEMAKALNEQLFFEFMENGRKGLKQFSENVVDTFCYFLQKTNSYYTQKGRLVDVVNPAQRTRAINELTQCLVNDIITGGFSKTSGTIFSTFDIIHHARNSWA